MNNKKKLGQFFTNPSIAEFMAKLVVDDSTKTLLDPAVGPGIFVEKTNMISNKIDITCYEIDNKMITEYKKNIKFDTNLVKKDYLTSNNNNKYDSIIANPPYNKFQEIDNRKDLIDLFERKYSIKLSGYSNYCIYFLIKSLNELNPNGKCAYIIPYEFMNAGYGEIVKEYILKTKMLSKIIKFDSNIKLFNDAMTTSCILYFENRQHTDVEFISIKSMDDFKNIYDNEYSELECNCYSYSDLDAREKWLKYFKTNNNNCFKNLIKFNEYAYVKRGIATGNNNYFNLNNEMINKYKLSKNVCIPCVTKSPDISKYIMTSDYFNELLDNGKKMYVFDGRNKKTINDEEYIKLGEINNVNKSYLNSHRSPWYGIEDKEPAPLWISVFSRDKLKIIRNEIMIKNLTTFHGIYPINYSEEEINIFFCYLQTPIAQRILRMNKREYGEGLDKFEPNDLNNAMVLNINIINDNDKKTINNIYQECKKNNILDIDRLNDVFTNYVIN